MIRSHGTESHMLICKLYTGTSKTKQLVSGQLDLPLVWMSRSATCVPACVILYHVCMYVFILLFLYVCNVVIERTNICVLFRLLFAVGSDIGIWQPLSVHL